MFEEIYTKDKMIHHIKNERTDVKMLDDDKHVDCEGIVVDIDEFYDIFIKQMKSYHNELKCIYSDDVSLVNVLRCTNCGAVIFAYNDERYDPCLLCPDCRKYDTTFKYFTKNEIDSDEDKRMTVEFYENLAIRLQETNQRQAERKGKADYELTNRKCIKLFNTSIYFQLLIESITNKFPLRGLNMNIDIVHWDDMSNSKNIIIPLSIASYRALHYNKRP